MAGAMNILDRIAQYQQKWLERLNQMDDHHILKQVWNYNPKGWRGVQRSVGVTSASLPAWDQNKLFLV